MSKKLKIFALITARSGSKSVKNKNILNLEGYPIIAYSIIAAKLAGIERIIISTDSRLLPFGSLGSLEIFTWFVLTSVSFPDFTQKK